MKVYELISKLESLPKDLDIVIMDWKKSAYFADGEGNTEGIYHKFSVDHDNDGSWTNAEGETVSVISLCFESDDFTEDGGIEYGSSLVDAITRELQS